MRNGVCALIIAALIIFMGTASAEPNADTLRLSYYNELETAALTELTQAYMKAHPNVVIQLEYVPLGSYFTNLESQAMGSLLPDVFVMHPGRVMDFISGGALMKLSQEEIDAARYPSAALQTYIYNGACYGIPKDCETVALCYNKYLFDRAAIAYPDDSWDWQKLREVAKALTDAESGTWGFYAPNDGPYGYYNLIYQHGGYVFKDGESGYGLQVTQQAVKLWAELTLVDRVSPPQGTYEGDLFLDGSVAMQLMPSGLLAEYDKGSAIHGQIGVAQVPSMGEQTVVLEATAYVAASNSRHKDAVQQFMRYLSGDQAAKIMGETMPKLPADAAARARYLDVNERFDMSCYEDALQGATPFPVSPMRAKWASAERDALDKVIAGLASAQGALAELSGYINSLE